MRSARKAGRAKKFWVLSCELGADKKGETGEILRCSELRVAHFPPVSLESGRDDCGKNRYEKCRLDGSMEEAMSGFQDIDLRLKHA